MTTPAKHERNQDQIAFWNGPGGKLWAAKQDQQDHVLEPVSRILLKHAAVRQAEHVVDIGCGCGSTTLELARLVGPNGHVLGIDVSGEMLARARERTLRDMAVDFVQVDATVHPFEESRADLLVSRFGVMFFADPALSFANMRRALKSGGRLVMACWRTPAENPWTMIPLKAAYQHVPPLPKAGPEEPGLFSFAEKARVNQILTDAGFTDIALQPINLTFDIAMGQGLDAAVQTSIELGPTMRAMRDQPLDLQAAATASIRAALQPMQQGQAVPLPAAIWIISARNP